MLLRPRTLRRPRSGRSIAGVVVGIARFYSINPNELRTVVLFLTVVTGILPGVVLYLALWGLIPGRAPAAHTAT